MGEEGGNQDKEENRDKEAGKDKHFQVRVKTNNRFDQQNKTPRGDLTVKRLVANGHPKQ